MLAWFRQEDYLESISRGINKRALEKGGIQRLLEELGYDQVEVGYRDTGQPYLKGEPDSFLSVSHAKGWFAVMVGTHPVGVDIQTFSPRLIQGQDYFRNEREVSFSEDEKALHLIWGAKEAFYKLKEGQIPDLKEEVSLITIEADSLFVEYQETAYELKFRIIGDAYLVFTT
ncbi:hypothetical protein D3C87_66230 [compost metagenome]